MAHGNHAILLAGATQLGVELSAAQSDALDHYVDLLLHWNEKLNLTAVTERSSIVERHLLDCLAVIPHLRGRRVIDVGTGAGLPSVVLAIARPELAIVAVESIHKKVSFVRAVARELRLSIEVRAERLERLELAAPFDFAISRATFAPEEWITRATHLVTPDGRLVAMLSAQQNVPPAPSGFSAPAVHEYRVGAMLRRIASYDADGVPRGTPSSG